MLFTIKKIVEINTAGNIKFESNVLTAAVAPVITGFSTLPDVAPPIAMSSGISIGRSICIVYVIVLTAFLHKLKAKAFQNRVVALVENGSWAPSAARTMKAILEPMKNLRMVEPVVSIRSTLKPETEAQLEALADAILAAK